MAANGRRKQKSPVNASNGDTEKTEVTGKGSGVPEESGSEEMTARIKKRIKDRLEKLEENRTRDRVKSTKKRSSSKGKGNGDYEVPVKKLRPSPSKPGGAGKRKSILQRVFSLLPSSKPHDYEELIDTLERMDEFGKVPDIENKIEALMMFLYKKYWRVETTGLENIPKKGRTLIVSNHSGVIPFDGAMMATAIYEFHPTHRYARCMIEDWFGRLPFGMEFMNAVGQVRACQENAERLLRQEQLVGVFPEGIKGMAKGFKNRYNLARFGRGGVIRLAIRTRSPIVPCAVVGAEEIYIVLGYANWLGKMVGLPLFPLTLTFPWLGLLGVVPLPTKWYINFGKVIRYDQYDDSVLKDNVIINRLNRELRATVQEMVDSLLKKRRSVFFG